MHSNDQQKQENKYKSTIIPLKWCTYKCMGCGETRCIRMSALHSNITIAAPLTYNDNDNDGCIQ